MRSSEVSRSCCIFCFSLSKILHWLSIRRVRVMISSVLIERISASIPSCSTERCQKRMGQFTQNEAQEWAQVSKACPKYLLTSASVAANSSRVAMIELCRQVETNWRPPCVPKCGIGSRVYSASSAFVNQFVFSLGWESNNASECCFSLIEHPEFETTFWSR